jgi:hypothetical protein
MPTTLRRQKPPTLTQARSALNRRRNELRHRESELYNEKLVGEARLAQADADRVAALKRAGAEGEPVDLGDIAADVERTRVQLADIAVKLAGVGEALDAVANEELELYDLRRDEFMQEGRAQSAEEKRLAGELVKRLEGFKSQVRATTMAWSNAWHGRIHLDAQNSRKADVIGRLRTGRLPVERVRIGVNDYPLTDVIDALSAYLQCHDGLPCYALEQDRGQGLAGRYVDCTTGGEFELRREQLNDESRAMHTPDEFGFCRYHRQAGDVPQSPRRDKAAEDLALRRRIAIGQGRDTTSRGEPLVDPEPQS